MQNYSTWWKPDGDAIRISGTACGLGRQTAKNLRTPFRSVCRLSMPGNPRERDGSALFVLARVSFGLFLFVSLSLTLSLSCYKEYFYRIVGSEKQANVFSYCSIGVHRGI